MHCFGEMPGRVLGKGRVVALLDRRENNDLVWKKIKVALKSIAAEVVEDLMDTAFYHKTLSSRASANVSRAEYTPANSKHSLARDR